MYATYAAEIAGVTNAAAGVYFDIIGPPLGKTALIKKLFITCSVNATFRLVIRSAVSTPGVAVLAVPVRFDATDATVAGSIANFYTTVAAPGAARDGGAVFQHIAVAGGAMEEIDFLKTWGKPIVLRDATEVFSLEQICAAAVTWTGGLIWDEVDA